MRRITILVSLCILIISTGAYGDGDTAEYYQDIYRYDSNVNGKWFNSSNLDLYDFCDFVSIETDSAGRVYILSAINYDYSDYVSLHVYDVDGSLLFESNSEIDGQPSILIVNRYAADIAAYGAGLYQHAPSDCNLTVAQLDGLNQSVKYSDPRCRPPVTGLVDAAGAIYVAADSEDRPSLLVKFSDALVEQWAVDLTGKADLQDLKTLALDSVGDLVLGGTADGVLVLAKYDANGNQLWEKRILSNEHDEAELEMQTLAVDGNDGIVVVGVEYEGGGPILHVYALDSAGELVWETARAGTLEAESREPSRALGFDDSGNIFVAGNLDGIGWGASKLDGFGNEQWTIYHDIFAQPISVTAAGELYAASLNEDSLNLLKIAPNGEQQATSKYIVYKYETESRHLWLDHEGGPVLYVEYIVDYGDDDTYDFNNDEDGDDDDDGCSC